MHLQDNVARSFLHTLRCFESSASLVTVAGTQQQWFLDACFHTRLAIAVVICQQLGPLSLSAGASIYGDPPQIPQTAR